MDKPERRASSQTETRVIKRADGTRQIVGYSARFDEWTTLYESKYFRWREVIRPGAFARALREKQDVRALFNHDETYVLGRSTAGTLMLREDKVGLFAEITPPDSQTINDLVVTPIERGDISGQSFAFMIAPAGEVVTIMTDASGRTLEDREILDVDLYDVGPVTFPQYESTDIALRAAGEARAQGLIQQRRAHLRALNLRMLALRLHER